MRANNILETIGNTPHVRINRLFGSNHEIWMKMERANPGASVKDRIGFAMIEDAERRGVISQESVIIEPTSGNTGIALAMAAAVKGYKLILVMPESMSIERRKIMTAYGAKLELTPREKGMKGAIEKAREMIEKTPNSWMPMQFDNEANLRIHRETTAQEILRDFPEGLDYIITGVGTGGHITACAEVLKPVWPQLQVWAVEPELSAVLSGRQPGPHPLQGLGAGFIPGIMRTDLMNGVITVTKDESFEFAKRAAKEEGIFIGISSGSALAAVAKKLYDIPYGKKILTFCYDTGERYLSIEGLFEA